MQKMVLKRKKAPRIKAGLFEMIVRREDRSWQAWQRPTLPRLKTQYHRRWGL
jgi:hypothetical protein